MIFVLDCSVTMPWLLKNDPSGYADLVLKRFTRDRAIVPELWYLEVANTLLVRERRKHVDATESRRFRSYLSELPIEVDIQTLEVTCEQVIKLSRDNGLSSYDGVYLELAQRQNLALATLDGKLRTAAIKTGVPLLAVKGTTPS